MCSSTYCIDKDSDLIDRHISIALEVFRIHMSIYIYIIYIYIYYIYIYREREREREKNDLVEMKK